MVTLGFYDVTGIQKFISGSVKAAEIVGASAIVQNALEKWLVDATNEVCPGAVTDWRKAGAVTSLGLTPPAAEVIYIGGGNALVAFSGTSGETSRSRAVSVTRQLSRKVFEETRGTLQIAVAYQECSGEDFAADMQILQDRLAEAKQRLVPARPMMGFAVTAEGSTDGLPAEYIEEAPTASVELEDDHRQFLSAPARRKRDKAKETRSFSNLLPDGLGDQYAFPVEFDDLWQVKGENHIGIVHIDGNSMGSTIERIAATRAGETYEVTAQRMRTLSRGISDAYQSAFKETVAMIPPALLDTGFCDTFGLRLDSGRCFLPVRPLIFNGDDITFVCNGRLAIWFATEVLRKISQKCITGLTDDGNPLTLSACAGVAIVKSHFPFARAYDLAEHLCSSAKKTAKAANSPPGSWMDFHIVYSGITHELDDLRKAIYNVPTMENATAVYRGCPAYNLLGRPWQVTSAAGQAVDVRHGWAAFETMYDTLKGDWPRSRLKDMRDVMISSEEETNEYLRGCRSRGFTLPQMWRTGGSSATAFTEENITPYYDALELLDFFVVPPKGA